jgi:hypothetical protein
MEPVPPIHRILYFIIVDPFSRAGTRWNTGISIYLDNMIPSIKRITIVVYTLNTP